MMLRCIINFVLNLLLFISTATLTYWTLKGEKLRILIDLECLEKHCVNQQSPLNSCDIHLSTRFLLWLDGFLEQLSYNDDGADDDKEDKRLEVLLKQKANDVVSSSQVENQFTTEALKRFLHSNYTETGTKVKTMEERLHSIKMFLEKYKDDYEDCFGKPAIDEPKKEEDYENSIKEMWDSRIENVRKAKSSRSGNQQKHSKEENYLTFGPVHTLV